jgi:methyltransferase
MPEITWTHVLFGAVLAIEGAQRIVELVVSKRRQEARAGEGTQTTRERVWLLMVITHVLLFVLPPLEVFLLHRPFLAEVGGPALVIYGLAKVLRWWALSTLGKSWNARVVAPNTVVSGGPYRFIRHPNYLVVIAELLVIPLVHTAYLSSLVLTVVNAVVLAVRIPTEEKVLFTIPGYREAMGGKARFIPGIL